MKAAKTYLTLMSTVAGKMRECGGDIGHTRLTESIDMLAQFPVSARPSGAGAVAPLAIVRGATVPATVVDRDTAVDHIKNVTERNKPILSFCYGFYSAMQAARDFVSPGAPVDTLRSAYSLKKLAFGSMYHEGIETFKDYQAVKNANGRNLQND